MSRRVLALWIMAGALALVLIGVLLFREDGAREAVEAYVTRANAVQVQVAPELRRVNAVYRELQLQPAKLATSGPELAEAVDTLRRLHQRLSLLEPPPEAHELHRRLLALVGMQVSFAGEVAELGAYLPKLQQHEKRLGAAGRTLSQRLQRRDAAVQRRALRDYAKTLRASAVALERLDAPRVLEPSRRTEVQRLRRLARLADEIRAALVRQDARAVQRALAELARSSSAQVTQAERLAFIDYNVRLRRIQEATVAVGQEQARLNETLG